MSIRISGYRLPRIAIPRITIHTGDKDHDQSYDRDARHHAILSAIDERAKNHPSTWEQYIDQQGGMMDIVAMEYAELMEQRSAGSIHGLEKELTDLAAACLCALKKMKAK